MTYKEFEQEAAYAYFFHCINGIGAKTIDYIYQRYGGYEKAYQTIKGWSKEGNIKRIDSEKVQLIISQMEIFEEKNIDVIEKYQELKKKSIRCFPKNLPGYPESLHNINNNPSVLYVKGKLPDPTRPNVAVIGARNCSQYGSLMAREIGQRLGEMGIGVISGLARGIDGISQYAALSAGGMTYGVLGCGVDYCYPEENFEIYNRLAIGENGGGLISEFPPGTKAESFRFPLRNRIISGLADAIIVVEAKEKSGTIITVNHALEQGKNVYAVPGRVCDHLSYGCNRLISQGASVLWDIGEFINEVFYEKQLKQGKNGNTIFSKNQFVSNEKSNEISKNMNSSTNQLSFMDIMISKKTAKLSGKQKQVATALDITFSSIDSILCKLDIQLLDLLSILAELENLDVAESENGFYRLKI